MRTRTHKAIWLRLRGATALAVYLVLLFYAHVHVVLEAHEHGWDSAAAEHHDSDFESDHDHDHDHEHEHDHVPHSASDHSLTATTSAFASGKDFFVHDVILVAELVLAPTEEATPVVGWSEDRPKHPPPRLPEQPRSPPLV